MKERPRLIPLEKFASSPRERLLSVFERERLYGALCARRPRRAAISAPPHHPSRWTGHARRFGGRLDQRRSGTRARWPSRTLAEAPRSVHGEGAAPYSDGGADRGQQDWRPRFTVPEFACAL